MAHVCPCSFIFLSYNILLGGVLPGTLLYDLVPGLCWMHKKKARADQRQLELNSESGTIGGIELG
jgi:hypothetical protein